MLAPKLRIRQRCPARNKEVIRTNLEIRQRNLVVFARERIRNRKEIFTPRTDRRGGFTPEKRYGGIGRTKLPIIVRMIIPAKDIKMFGKILKSRLVGTYRRRTGTRRVLRVNDGAMLLGKQRTDLAVLIGHFVTAAPQNDARMIPIAANQSAQVLFMPVGI